MMNADCWQGFDPRTGSLVVPDKGVPFINPLFPKDLPIVTASQAQLSAKTHF